MAKVKELHYFTQDRFYNQGEKYLNGFFENNDSAKIRGAAYVHMLTDEKCPERVFSYNPETKLIEPVSRAYSAYQYAIRNSWENPEISFLDTMKLEENRMNGNFTERHELTYFYHGLYHLHLSNWLKYFPRKNILIINQDLLEKMPVEAMKNIFQFLSVDDSVSIDTTIRFNTAGVSKFSFINRIINNPDNPFTKLISNIIPFKLKLFLRTRLFPFIYKLNTVEKKYPPLTGGERKIVGKYFENDLDLLARDFGIKFIL